MKLPRFRTDRGLALCVVSEVTPLHGSFTWEVDYPSEHACDAYAWAVLETDPWHARADDELIPLVVVGFMLASDLSVVVAPEEAC